MSSQKRAVAGASFFIVFGIVGITLALQHLMLVWPLIIVYGTLVWNGYASHSFVAKVIPSHTIIQRMLHAILFFLHLSLALSFSHPEYFSVLVLAFLLFETLTYVLRLPSVPRPALLFRKIKINMIESLLALLAFVGIFFEYTQFSLIVWSILLTDISIYSIFFRKMYAIPNLS